MDLLRPKRIYKKEGGPFQTSFEISTVENYSFIESDVEITKTLDTVYTSVPISPFEAQIPNVGPLSQDIIEAYHNFQSLINHCINSSEVINKRLRDLLLSVKGLKVTSEELMAMDFMTLRGIFSDFLHGFTEIKREENFNTKQKRKAITSVLYNYISDRNIYTHGTLKLRRPDDHFIIEYIENKKKKVHAEVSIEILESNLKVSSELRAILSEINGFINPIKPLI